MRYLEPKKIHGNFGSSTHSSSNLMQDFNSKSDVSGIGQSLFNNLNFYPAPKTN